MILPGIQVNPGFDEINSQLGRLSDNISRKALLKGLRETAKPMARKMRQKAWKKTGALRRSIGFRSVKRKSLRFKGIDKTGAAIRVGSVRKVRDKGRKGKVIEQVFKAYWQEYGTVHITPKPFMIPAYKSEKSRVAPRVSKAIDDAIAKF